MWKRGERCDEDVIREDGGRVQCRKVRGSGEEGKGWFG